MKNTHIQFFAYFLTIILSYNNIIFPQNFVWLKNAGGSNSDNGFSIFTDANGNSYITGHFSGTATFGTTQLVSDGGKDIFIAKYDVNGNCVWAKNAGGSDWDQGFGISTDANGNSYITGYISGTATFDTTQLVSYGAEDIFIAKYDVNGNCVWAKNAGGSADYENGLDISTDANGNSYITGRFEGTATFGSTQLVSDGYYDIFIAKYDVNGNCVWAKNAGGSGWDQGNGISTDANGNTYITGSFSGTATFGSTQLVSYGYYDIFIAKYNANGNCVWAKNAGGSNYDYSQDISTDANGNSYITGRFEGTATFGSTQLVSDGDGDIFIAKYDANGNCVWAKNAGGNDFDYGYGNSISTDADGNSYITGLFEGTATFGSTQLVSNGDGDIFIAKYDVNGNCVWAKNAGGSDFDYGSGISVDNSGNIYVTGFFTDEIRAGEIVLPSYGNEDIFISCIKDEVPVIYDRVDFYHNVGISSTNPENYLNPGKSIKFKLRIINSLSTNILTGYGYIRCTTPGVTITDSIATFNNILSGQSGWSVDDYEINVSSTVPFGTRLNFILTVTQSLAPIGPWESEFSFPIAPLSVNQIFIDDDQHPDSYGNNNKIPEPGETVEVIPILSNMSTEDIYYTSGSLKTNLSGITIWNDVTGVTGQVYDTWYYNVLSNIPQPIPIGVNDIQPEKDYVFTYSNISPYPSLPFSIDFNAYINDNPSTSWDSGGILIKWEHPFEMANGIVSVANEDVKSDIVPSKFELSQNYPNPFNPITKISYAIPKNSFVELKVFNLLGQEITTLVNEQKGVGNYEVNFNASDLPSGIYIYKLRAGEFVQSKKMILMK